jgi:dTDP-glucose 4,6-dehydratase
MRVMVAGGAGFVGSHLVELLLERGDDVVVVDSLLTGSIENLAHLPRERVTLLIENVETAPHGEYERVYHLASPASPEAYDRHQVATLTANAIGTQRLLDVAERCGARFLLASTSEIYGDPLEHPQRETYWGNVDPIGPRSMYDEAKRYAEAMTVAYVRERGADARIVRIFNAYGPRMQLGDGRMPSAFIGAALRGAPLEVHGDGSQTRSLCFVKDTVRGLVAAMDRGSAGEAYNIGRADEFSVLEFALRVILAAGSYSRVRFVPGRSQDIQRRRPDGTKAERELGWTPQTPLDVGLRRTLEWYRAALDGADAAPPTWSRGKLSARAS